MVVQPGPGETGLTISPGPRSGQPSPSTFDEKVEAYIPKLVAYDDDDSWQQGRPFATPAGTIRLEVSGVQGLDLQMRAVLVGAAAQAAVPAAELFDSDPLKDDIGRLWVPWVEESGGGAGGVVVMPGGLEGAEAVRTLGRLLNTLRLGECVSAEGSISLATARAMAEVAAVVGGQAGLAESGEREGAGEASVWQ